MQATLAKTLLILILATIQISCSYLSGDDGVFRDRKSDYLTAPTVPDMRVPDDLDSYTLDQLYVVPEQVVPNADNFGGDIPRPKPLDTNRPEGVVIRRFSGENWIVIAASPGQVWPRVRDFWTQRGTELDYENPVDGVMETVWLTNLANPLEREKYRLRIEPGIHAGSSEISLVQIARPAAAPGNELVVWPRLSQSEDREFAMLQEISQYLADRTDIYSSSSSSLLAGSLAGASKASLVEDRGLGPVLELRLSLNRAWGQIGQALNEAGLEVVERDRDNSEFQVQFSGIALDQESGGFLSRVFGDDTDDGEAARLFRVNLEETRDLIRVTARPVDGASLPGLETDLLQTILSNL
ncbi:MAG: outer membrane protein assembly factor BamC [Gammaproteobacteria bacterium]|nr:outer membrane protein assembly factor BamC [Pseudomonadales bacterium]MCP5345990.1 outer membrane protein assembly factor BamC [Pseudomonadales bacterium]